MKHVRILSLLLATLMLLSLLCACGDGSTETETQTEEETVAPVDPSTLGEPSGQYETSRGSTLTSYANATAETFDGVCAWLNANGYATYGTGQLNRLLSATYTKDGEVTHVYYVPARNELNIAHDPSNGLPVQDAEPTVGSVDTSVTQLSAQEINGMGYVIQLSDGTFIVVDGGYTTNVKQLRDLLVSLNGGDEDTVHVRMWILSHSHDDHYPALRDFAKRYGKRIRVDCLAFCPVAKADELGGCGCEFFSSSEMDTLISQLSCAPVSVCTLHTGMTFHFSNVELEILMTADEMYIDGGHSNFNASSTVCRVRDENGKTFLMLADSNVEAATAMKEIYGDYLKSDICQAAHHGVEDFPLEVYNIIRPSILFYPCTTSLYKLKDRDADVRAALRDADFVKEILVRDKNQDRRYFKDIE